MSTLDPELNSPTVPAFLTKLRLLVDDEETNDLIYWDRDGASFHICDGNRLAKEILPLFFKHNNLSSFIRQLNMYGFRKVNRVDPTSAFKTESEDMEFKHPYFLREKPHLMGRIQRKPHTNVSGGFLFGGRAVNSPVSSYFGSAMGQSLTGMHHTSRLGTGTTPELERLYIMIRGLRANQDTMANQLSMLQSENQLLYRELSELRDRHEQQSQLIQTLFTFLSAFAKDGAQTSNFRFGPNKRRALPFTPSNVFPSSTHSGLKLNLPKGFDLNDYTKTVHPLQLAASDEALPSPYKIAKMDFRALPTNVPESTHHRLSPTSADALGKSPRITPASNQLASTSQQQQQQLLIHSTHTLSHPATHRMLAKSNRAHPEFKRMINFLARQSERNPIIDESVGAKDALKVYGKSITTRHVTEPGGGGGGCASPSVSTFTLDDQDPYCLRPDVKPVISQEDLTMTSLTHASATTASAAATSPLVTVAEASGNASVGADDAGDSQLIDLNLSRCTTPVSLIQPDSVDLTEFLAAARADDESEISMDDLFLASSALESSSTKGELQSGLPSGRVKPDTVADLSFETSHSQDGEAAISLPDVCAEEVVASDTEKDHMQSLDPIDPADLDEITLDPISDCASITTTEAESLNRCAAKLIPSTLNTPSLRETGQQQQQQPEEEGQLADRELFGLPWEDGLIDSVEDACDDEDDDAKSFNVGLLPPCEISPNSRLKGLTESSLPAKDIQPESFIVGNEIIPVEAAAPFANVSVGNLVQILQPTLISVSAVRQSPMSTSSTITSAGTVVATAPATNAAHPLPPVQAHVSVVNSLSTSSPPLMRSRFQPRPIATVLAHTGMSNSVGGATNALGTTGPVSSTQCMIPVLPLTTVALGQPMIAATTRPVTWTLPVGTKTQGKLSQPVHALGTAGQSARTVPARTTTVYKKIAPAPRPIAKSSATVQGNGKPQQANVTKTQPERPLSKR